MHKGIHHYNSSPDGIVRLNRFEVGKVGLRAVRPQPDTTLPEI